MNASSSSKLFLVDAYAMIFRAHFAFMKNPRRTSTGLNTSAVFGFANMLFDVLLSEKPSHIGVAFDTPKPTFRHERYPEYKAQREETPEDIILAVPYIKRLLAALRIPILQVDGYEADDVIGTLAWKASDAGVDTYMLTPDKDFAQLVRPNVWLYRPGSKFAKTEVLDANGVVEKFGVRPDQIADFLGLKGDSVDNIPGVPKIGDKTAVELLQQYGNLEAILENVEAVTKKSIQKTLQENGEQGRLSKELATILCDAPIELDLADLVYNDPNRQDLEELFRELEFRTLAKRILGEEIPVGSATLFDSPKEAATAAKSDFDASQHSEMAAKTLADVEVNYQLAETEAEQQALVNRLATASEFAFDTETTGLDAMAARVVGMSFCLKSGEAFYVPVPEEEAAQQAVFERFRGVLTSGERTIIGQNLKYDYLVMLNHGIQLQGPFYDTMVAHYVLRSDGKHGMDALALQYLGYKPIPISELIGPKGKKQKSMADIPPADVTDYACEDADITFQLKQVLDADLQAEEKLPNLYQDVDLPLVPVLSQMEYAGVRVNRGFLEEYAGELGGELADLEAKVYEAAGEEFNINSPKQLGDIIFGKLELAKGKKTKTGQYSTDERTLSKLAAEGHELPARVLNYRSIAKLKSTYVEALPKLINERTGLVHTTFNAATAVTGRLSSNNPNLQNIPIRTERGREVRKAFIPRSEAFTLLSADYSQVELRIMAAFSQDEHMLGAFSAGEDIHRATAAKVFGVDLADVSSEMRRRAKTVNFGMIYGITPFGLSDRLGISRGEANDIHDNFFAQFPAVKQFMDQCVELARALGYAETHLGRRHYLPDIDSKNRTTRQFAERNAINTPIQGTAADLIKLAMVRVANEIERRELKSRLVLQVHDELVLDAHLDELDELKELVREGMMNAMQLEGVTFDVDMGAGENWLEAH